MCSQNSEPSICVCPKLEAPSLALFWGVDDLAVDAGMCHVAAGSGHSSPARGSGTHGGPQAVVREEEAESEVTCCLIQSI